MKGKMCLGEEDVKDGKMSLEVAGRNKGGLVRIRSKSWAKN